MNPHINEKIIEAIEEMVRTSKEINGFEINPNNVTIFLQNNISEEQMAQITKNAKEIFGGLTEYEISLPN